MTKLYFTCLMILGAFVIVSCVQVDPKTGETLPRGDQRYEFETVERRAEQLKSGLSKTQALLLLGSPAEKSSGGDVWVYLPERPAVIVPGRSLRLVFEDDLLVKHSYRAIILGEDL